MFNPYMNAWRDARDRAEFDTPLFIVIEHDVIDENNLLSAQPFIRRASLHKDFKYDVLFWKLLDFDPECEEEVLQQHFSVVAWRYVGEEKVW